jgi:hypothetical protein
MEQAIQRVGLMVPSDVLPHACGNNREQTRKAPPPHLCHIMRIPGPPIEMCLLLKVQYTEIILSFPGCKDNSLSHKLILGNQCTI